MAFLLGVGQVVLAWFNRPLNFWLGLFSVMIYTFLFYQGGLYAESLLNLYYMVISIWGIFSWKSYSGTDHSIGVLSTKEWKFFLVLVVAIFFILFLLLMKFTDSSVPKWDALVSSLAWIGSWLLVKRKVENWLFLSFSNVLAIPLQWSKGLELTSLLTIIYLFVGVVGFLSWRKKYLNSLK